ncbi:MAG: hypothetical protein ACRDCC_08485 [Culicoidibacterales bacterium]
MNKEKKIKVTFVKTGVAKGTGNAYLSPRLAISNKWLNLIGVSMDQPLINMVLCGNSIILSCEENWNIGDYCVSVDGQLCKIKRITNNSAICLLLDGSLIKVNLIGLNKVYVATELIKG